MDTESKAKESLRELIRERNLNAGNLDSIVDVCCGFSDLVADCVEWCHTPDREQTIRNVDVGLQELFSDEKCASLFGRDSALPDVLLQLCRSLVPDSYASERAMLNTLREEKREGLRKRLLALASDS